LSCNPYAEFGFGDYSLPACPSSFEGPLGPQPAPVDPLTLGICELPREQIEQAIYGIERIFGQLGAGDPQRDPRYFAPASQSASYFDMLQARANALRECLPRARMASEQLALAQALIQTGQLKLGPEAFSSPAAMSALAAGLAAAGGSMSSPLFFGVGGVAPGPTMPFSFLPTVDPTFSTGVLGTLGNVAIGLGGQFLQNQLLAKQQEDAFKRQRDLLLLQAQLQAQTGQRLGFGEQQGNVVVGADGTIRVGNMQANAQMTLTETPQGPIWTMVPGGAGCCPTGPVTVSPADAPSLYKQGCGPCGTMAPRSRFYALRANGSRDLFVRVGTVNSVAPRVLTRFAKRWAKAAKLTVGSRGTRRGRRRPR